MAGAAWAGLFAEGAAGKGADGEELQAPTADVAPAEHRALRTVRPVAPAIDESRFHAAPETVLPGDALEVEHPIRLLPRDTVFVAWTDNLDTVVAELGLVDVLTRHRAALQEVDEELAEVGLDLMDLVDPSGLGLDPAGPGAIAVVSAKQPVIILAAAIASEESVERAIETLTESTATTYRKETMNDALVTIEEGDQPRMAFVRRGGHLFVVVGESYFSDVSTVVAQIAWEEPEDGLPTTDAWNEVVPRAPAQLGRIFVNGPAIYAAMTADLRRNIDEHRNRTLETALDTLENSWTARLEGQLAFVEAFFGSIGGAAFGVELDNGRIGVRGRVALAPDSMLRGLFRNRTRESALQRAMDVAPVYLIDGALEPKAIRQLAELFAGATGGNLDRAMAAVQAFAGLETDPLDILNGALGVAVTMEDPAEGDHRETVWGVTATIGIADPGAAQQIIDSLSKLTPLTGLASVDEQTGGLTIKTPHWRTLHVALVGETLVVTTDRSFMDRMSTGRGALAQAFERTDLSNLLRSVRDIGQMVLDFDILRPAFGFRSYAVAAPSVEVAGTDQTELERIQAEVDRVRAESKARERDAALGLLGLAGELAWSARFDGDTVSIVGGMYTQAASARDLVAAMADGLAVIAAEEKHRNDTIGQLYEKRAEAVAAETAPLE